MNMQPGIEGVILEEMTELTLADVCRACTAHAESIIELVDEGIIYKRRGVGMFVCPGAREKIMIRRRQSFFKDYLLPMMEEAKNLGLSREDVVGMLNHSTGEE